MLARRTLLYSLLCTSLGLMALATAGSSSNTAGNDWKIRGVTLLPATGQQAQVLEIKTQLSLVQLRRKAAEAGADAQILNEVLGSGQRGQLPGYDPRLKISEAEFRRYLVFDQALQPSGKMLRLSVQRDGNRLIFGDMGGTALLRGISIDLSSGEMRFPEGFSARPDYVYISALQAAQKDDPLGARSGYVWQVRGSNPTTQTALNGHFALMGFSNGTVLLSYSRNGIVRGTVAVGSLNLSYTREANAGRW